MNTRELFTDAKKIFADLVARKYLLSQIPAKIESVENLFKNIIRNDLANSSLNTLKKLNDPNSLFHDIEIQNLTINALRNSVMQRPLGNREAFVLETLMKVAPEHVEEYKKFFKYKLVFVDGVDIDALLEPTALSPRLSN